MVCPQCCGHDEFFDEKLAAKELRRYQRRGPMPSTRRLIELLKQEGVDGATILDIGGGIGAIQHELLSAGATSATDVDGSPAYLEIARGEAERQGHADRVTYRHGDFVEVADELEDADIVTLDRVICCYPDMPALVECSTARARRLYGLVFPRTHWLMRVAQPIMNLYSRLKRCPLRLYLHAPDDVHRVVSDAGLTLHASRRTFLWRVELYRVGRAS